MCEIEGATTPRIASVPKQVEGHGGTAKRGPARAGGGARGSRKPKGNRRSDVAAVDAGFRPEVVRDLVGDAMALSRDGSAVADRGDSEARSDLDLQGPQGRAQLNRGEWVSWLGLCLGVALVIIAAATPR